MAINVAGATTGTGQEVETAQRAARVTLKPIDVQTGATGSFRKAMISGTIGAGASANSDLYAFRWAPTPNTAICLIRRVVVSIGNSATAFTAGLGNVQMFAARAFSAIDTGGTAGTFTTNNGKLRTNYATSLGATCIIANTGANSDGTRTLDTDQCGIIAFGVPNVAGTFVLPPTEIFRAVAGEAPLVLANNEGFVLKGTVPATGTWTLGVTVDWDEVLSYAG